MSKTKYKLEIILEVDNEGHEEISHSETSKSIEYAVKNALDSAEENGFNHPLAHKITISRGSVEVI